MALEYARETTHLEHVAGDYVESPFDRRMRGYMMRALAPWMPPDRGDRGPKALQMGCFHGDLTVNLAAAYRDLTVVDAAESFLERTRERVPVRVRFARSLFERWRPAERFDAIFLVHTLEHVIDPVTVLARAGEWLAEGGRLFVVVPNGSAASRQIAVKMGVIPELGALTRSDVQHGHRRTYFMDTLERDVRGAGLRAIATGGVFFKPLANFQLDALAGTALVTEAYMEGCYELGKRYPDLCASVFVVAERGAS
jgi:2-polyprenyl-3-methyl-5-hydroxy-6-metoxy-1,4-benzoquinol methylase